MIHRFDTLPLDQVATLNGTRCDEHTQCGLVTGHDGPCADVSPVGLVHEVLPDLTVTGGELDALNRIKSAYNELEDAIQEAESVLDELERSGPTRIKKLLARSGSYMNVDWPISADADDWPEDLAEFGDPS